MFQEVNQKQNSVSPKSFLFDLCPFQKVNSLFGFHVFLINSFFVQFQGKKIKYKFNFYSKVVGIILILQIN